MIIGANVKSINETCGMVFIELSSEDGSSIQLRFKSEDPRVQEFAFRQNAMVEIETAIASAPRLAIAR